MDLYGPRMTKDFWWITPGQGYHPHPQRRMKGAGPWKHGACVCLIKLNSISYKYKSNMYRLKNLFTKKHHQIIINSSLWQSRIQSLAIHSFSLRCISAASISLGCTAAGGVRFRWAAWVATSARIQALGIHSQMLLVFLEIRLHETAGN